MSSRTLSELERSAFETMYDDTDDVYIITESDKMEFDRWITVDDKSTFLKLSEWV